MCADLSYPDGRRAAGSMKEGKMKLEIYQWMKNLAFFHILFTAVLHLLPDRKYESYFRLFMGLLLMLLVSIPVFSILGRSEELLENFEINYQKEEIERKRQEAEDFQKVYLREALKDVDTAQREDEEAGVAAVERSPSGGASSYRDRSSGIGEKK